MIKAKQVLFNFDDEGNYTIAIYPFGLDEDGRMVRQLKARRINSQEEAREILSATKESSLIKNVLALFDEYDKVEALREKKYNEKKQEQKREAGEPPEVKRARLEAEREAEQPIDESMVKSETEQTEQATSV